MTCTKWLEGIKLEKGVLIPCQNAFKRTETTLKSINYFFWIKYTFTKLNPLEPFRASQSKSTARLTTNGSNSFNCFFKGAGSPSASSFALWSNSEEVSPEGLSAV